MATRHAGRVDEYRRLRIPPDDVLAFVKRDLATRPEETTHSARLSMRADLARLGAEGVAEPMEGTNERRTTRVVVESASHFADQVRQVGLDHERVRPEMIVQL